MMGARLPNTMPFLDMPVALLERSAATRAKGVQCVSLSGAGLPRKKHNAMLHDRRSQPACRPLRLHSAVFGRKV